MRRFADIFAVSGHPNTRLKLITFDPFRTLGLPGVRYIKPEAMRRYLFGDDRTPPGETDQPLSA